MWKEPAKTMEKNWRKKNKQNNVEEMKTFCYVWGLIEDINYPQGDIKNHKISFLECGGRSSNGSACNMVKIFPGGEKRFKLDHLNCTS